MAWVFAQVFLAFALAVAIVWWTFPKTKKTKLPADAGPETQADGNAVGKGKD